MVDYCNVANLKNTSKGVYIGRAYKGLKASKWGNPFVLSNHSREEAIQKYTYHLLRQIKSGAITKQDLLELRGQTLLCFCKPLACHGDKIQALLKILIEDEAHFDDLVDRYGG